MFSLPLGEMILELTFHSMLTRGYESHIQVFTLACEIVVPC